MALGGQIVLDDGTLLKPVPVQPPLPVAEPQPSPPPAPAPAPLPVATGLTQAQIDAANQAAAAAAAGAAALLAGQSAAEIAATEQAAGATPDVVQAVADSGIPGTENVDVASTDPIAQAAAGIDDIDEAAAIANANDPDLTDLLEWDFDDPFGVQVLSADAQPLKGGGALSSIAQACSDYGVDTLAAVANALHEGPGGTVGDGGIAYGPFQDHLQVAGRPFANVGTKYDPVVNAWAWSDNGIRYCVRSMVNGKPSAKGLTGHAAVYAIVYGFEKPGDEAGAYKLRAAEYDHLKSLGKDWAAYAAPKLAGPVTGGAVDTKPITGSAPAPAPSVPAGVNAQWRGLVDVFAKEVPAASDTMNGLAESLVGVFK